MKLTKKNSVLKLFVEDHKRSVYGILYLLSYAIIPFILGYFFKIHERSIYISGFVWYVSLQCICGLVWLFIYTLRYLFIDDLLMATFMSYMPITKEDLVNNNITDLNKWLLLMKYLGDKYFRKMLNPIYVRYESDFDDWFEKSYQVFLDYVEKVTSKKQECPDLEYIRYKYHAFYDTGNEHLRYLSDKEYLEFILNKNEEEW